MTKKLPYDFHDATVVKCDVKKGKRLRIKIQLYKIFHPKQEILTLTFYGVNETQKIFDLSRGLHESCQEKDWNGTRVCNISFDAIKESKEGEFYFFMEFEGIKSERISCTSYKIELDEKTSD